MAGDFKVKKLQKKIFENRPQTNNCIWQMLNTAAVPNCLQQFT